MIERIQLTLSLTCPLSFFQLHHFLLRLLQKAAADFLSLTLAPYQLLSMWQLHRRGEVSQSVTNSLWPHGLQHAMFPWPSPIPRAYSNSCPSSQWCHPTVSSSIIPFSSCLQSFPVSRSFPVSQFFTSGGPSIGASASASATVHPGGIQATSYLCLSTRCLAQCRFHGWCTTSVGINIEKLYYFYSMKYSVDPHGLKNRVYFPWCDTSSQ